MKQQKPILHGRDHACGGADPIPGICVLTGEVITVSQAWLYFRYRKNWVPISIDGTGLRFPEDQTGGAALDGTTISWVFPDDPDHSRADGWYWIAAWESTTSTPPGRPGTVTGGLSPPDTTLAGQAIIGRPTGTGPASVNFNYSGTAAWTLYTEAVDIWLMQGVYTGTGPDGGWEPPGLPYPELDGTGNSTVRLWPSSYPISNRDVADTADINPLKLEHPGGTTSFLRADGTWAAPSGGIAPSEFAAKGDLLAGTAPGAFDNLPAGTNGQVLTADSTQATGLKWAAATADPADDTSVWMPLVDSDGTCVLDDTGLIPTLIPLV